MNIKIILIFILVCIQSFPVLALDCLPIKDTNRKYGDRGDRCEGKYYILASRGKLKIDLVSATAFLDTSSNYFSSFLIAKFCHRNHIPYITVEGLKSSYRIDRFDQSRLFEAIDSNCVKAKWSSDIIKWSGLKMRDLGIVVRLNNPSHSIEENITPAIFYSSEKSIRSANLSKYVFSFKTNQKIKWKYYISHNNKLIDKSKKYRTASTSSIIKVKWDGKGHNLGTYKLTIENEENTFHKIVNFQHDYRK